MKHAGLFFILCLNSLGLMSQTKPILYMIPGQGGDARLFQNLSLEEYDLRVIEFLVPEKGERMPSYARRMAANIDTSENFSLLGVSLGGMVATEISKFYSPEHLILISSAKGRHEFPARYRFMRYLPLYKLFPGSLLKGLTNIVRPWFEPEGKRWDETFTQMINDKDPKFMHRALHLILTWENTEVREDVLHIHGDKDRTLPHKKIQSPVTIEAGSHMIVMTRAEEVEALVREKLAE